MAAVSQRIAVMIQKGCHKGPYQLVQRSWWFVGELQKVLCQTYRKVARFGLSLAGCCGFGGRFRELE